MGETEEKKQNHNIKKEAAVAALLAASLIVPTKGAIEAKKEEQKREEEKIQAEYQSVDGIQTADNRKIGDLGEEKILNKYDIDKSPISLKALNAEDKPEEQANENILNQLEEIEETTVTTAANLIDNLKIGNNVYATLTDEGVLTISGTGNMYDYNKNTKPSWTDQVDLTKVVIEEGVTSIGSYLFYQCTDLTEVTLPQSLKIIGGYTFAECSNLAQINIPSSVTTINGRAFLKCTSLSEITIPNGVTYIATETFSGCTNLLRINLPQGLQTIQGYAFDNCINLQSIEFPSNLKSINERSFRYCKSLVNVEIPDSVTNVSWGAFTGCSNLKSIKLPSTITTIGQDTFRECTSLESIDIPDSVTTIGVNAFYLCTNLQSVELPENLSELGNYVFRNCENLTSIEIPDSVTTMGFCVFLNCTRLESANIPTGITEIPEGTFSSCSSLKSIVIPEGITTIDKEAFKLCSNLESADIPSTVTSIGTNAFGWCSKLTITCTTDSAAKEYAIQNNRNYKIYSTDVTLNESNGVIDLISNDKEIKLTETVVPYDATELDIVWSSDDEEISTVDQTGKIIGLKNGITKIRATSVNGKEGIFDLTVQTSLQDVELVEDNITLDVSQDAEYQIELIKTPETANANDTIIYTSSDEDIAIVDEYGKITGISNGTANIVAKLENGKEVTCEVTVQTSVTYIELNKDNISLDLSSENTKEQLIAILNPEAANAGTELTWISSNEEIVIVDQNGLVEAKENGEATITVRSENGKTATCNVLVQTSPESIELDKTNGIIDLTSDNKTIQLEATVLPQKANIHTSITWTSSNEEVAEVNQDGKVTGKSNGTAIIKATSENGKTAELHLTVQTTLQDIELAKNEMILDISDNNEYKIEITKIPPTANVKDTITYTSSNNKIVEVNQDGKITGKSNGTAEITVMTEDGNTAKLDVTVQTSVVNISLNKTSTILSLNQSQEEKLKATISPKTANVDTNLTWYSTNEEIATVDQNGVITAVSNGETQIKVISENGKEAICHVTVGIEIESITLDKTEGIIELTSDDKQIQLEPKILPEEANMNDEIAWTSSNKKVAEVDENGIITGKTNGKATITATTANGKTAKFQVTVQTTLQDIAVNESEIELDLNSNKEYQLDVIKIPATANVGDKITYRSSDTSKVIISSTGKIKAVSDGTVDITAITEDNKMLAIKVRVRTSQKEDDDENEDEEESEETTDSKDIIEGSKDTKDTKDSKDSKDAKDTKENNKSSDQKNKDKTQESTSTKKDKTKKSSKTIKKATTTKTKKSTAKKTSTKKSTKKTTTATTTTKSEIQTQPDTQIDNKESIENISNTPENGTLNEEVEKTPTEYKQETLGVKENAEMNQTQMTKYVAKGTGIFGIFAAVIATIFAIFKRRKKDDEEEK